MPSLIVDRDKVVARRKALGLTQKELADTAGISRAILSLIESGRRHQVELETLSRLAAGLQIAPLDLLVSTSVETVETDEDRIMARIRQMLAEYPHLKEGLAILADRRPRVIMRALEMAMEMQAEEIADELARNEATQNRGATRNKKVS